MILTSPTAPRGASSAERLMWITPDRVFYAGLLGTPSPRTQGALVMYVAMDAPLRIRIGGVQCRPLNWSPCPYNFDKWLCISAALCAL